MIGEDTTSLITAPPKSGSGWNTEFMIMQSFFWRCVLASVAAALLLAQGATAQSDGPPITLDEAVAYARQHSPLLSAARQTVLGRKAAVAAARAERLPRVAVDAGLRGNSLATETALGFPLTPLSDLSQQPFSHAHLNGMAEAMLPLYTGGRLGAERHLAEAETRVAQANVEDVERERASILAVSS